LEWLNTPDADITKLALDVMRENEGVEVQKHRVELPEFTTTQLPERSEPLSKHMWAEAGQCPEPVVRLFQYMLERNLSIEDTDYHWSPTLAYRDRLIIPFRYEGRIVGYTARTVGENKVKYLTDSQPGYVFNLDEQGHNKVFTILCEGPIDALHVDGCALTGSDINDAQALLLNRLGKDIYVVPDRDRAGAKLVEQAIEQGWHVSMPEWESGINDIGDAVSKYGRLYTLYSIANSAESSPLKIRLRAKKWFI